MKFWKWLKIKFTWNSTPLWKSEGSDNVKKKINDELVRRIKEGYEKGFR